MSTISIIGAGDMAAAIVGRVAKAGHTVEVISRDPAKRGRWPTSSQPARPPERGAQRRQATSSSSPCPTRMPQRWWPSTERARRKAIIDITNPINSDATGVITPAGSSGAQEIAEGAPTSAHVVKAFNTIFGHVLAKGGRLDAFENRL